MKPRATYRLQLHAGFTFADAAAAVPYLAELGISHLYLSPVLQAAEGSTHGYDVVDPDRVSAQLGGEHGFRALVDAARGAGLAILLDIVPNHMSIAGTANRWWLDVLEDGPASYYAHFFDVDWAVGDDRVLLPVLGERYGRALTSGTLAIVPTEGGLGVRAGDLVLPISPRSIGPIVRRVGDRRLDLELQFVGDALTSLPSSREREPDARRRRHRDKAVLLRRLRELARAEPAIGRAIEDELAAINADPVALDAVLEFQNYRLAHWSVAGDQLPYRRFFDIATLVGIRTEDPDVFEASHHRIFGWLADGTIDGVRVDHIDGQRAPAAYLRRVHEAAPDGWLLVEKVLGDGERLPASWPIDGTSGYDFLDHAGRLFLDPEGEPALTRAFEAYTGAAFDPVSASRAARLEVMSDALHSELARLTELAARACATSPACRDYTRPEIETALAEILAGYATYRTYLGEGPADATGLDRARIARAVAAAGRARPELDRDLLGFLDAALGFELPGPEALELARATQQISGPVVAKGDEDTLSYRQVRLLSRCEVGSHLTAFGIEPAELHRRLAAGPPRSLLATSTHDTKRSEDVRMRIAAISELPEAWAAAVARWGERAAAGWGGVEPDRVLEYAMWQSLVGAWPLPLERAQRFAEKATREARLRTSWRRPDPAYEAARTRWLAGVYADRALIDEIARFALELRPHGDRNSLALLVVKLVAPGIPDVYQGSELRDDSLVDPDNRRPVDLAARRRLLHELDHAPRGGDLGAAKLWTIRRVLALRRVSPALFDGEYRALVAAGAHAERVFAFARVAAAGSVIAIVPRLGARADGWRDTRLVLPPGIWRDVLVDREHENAVALADAWRTFPVAVLVRV